MINKLILAPQVNEAELLRTLARHGLDTFGVRVMNVNSLAEYALMKSGLTAGSALAAPTDSAAMLYEIMKDTTYYASSSYVDAQNFCRTLESLRGLITDNEGETMRSLLSGGEFPQANKAFFDVYNKYISRLEKDGLTDSIGYVRRALEKASPLGEEMIVLDEFPVSPLGKVLAKKLSGSVTYTSMKALLGLEDKPLSDVSFMRSRGSMNEAKDVLNRIINSNATLDSCVIACADVFATPLMFYELCEQYGLKVTMGCGLPASRSYPAALLKAIEKWCTNGLYGVDALNGVVFSDWFDTNALTEALGCDRKLLHKAVECAGGLRLSFSHDINEQRISVLADNIAEDSEEAAVLAIAQKLSAEFEKGIPYIIDRYAVIRKTMTPFDTAAKNMICRELDVFDDTDSVIGMIQYVLKKNVCCENSAEGCLHITGISQAAACLRKNLFVTGLTADFPGKPKENYLICDKDMQRFSDDAPTSLKILADKKRALKSLLTLAASAGCDIGLSYSGYDTAQLKDNNPSSVLFEIFREIKGEGASVNELMSAMDSRGYFSSVFDKTELIASEYSQGVDIVPEKADDSEPADIDMSRIKISPSKIGEYLTCQKRFYYNTVLGLRKKSPIDPLNVIEPWEIGTLFHDEVMQKYGFMGLSEDELAMKAREVWQRYILKHPPIKQAEANKQGADFEKWARTAYRWSADYESVMNEENISFTHSKGFEIGGRLDRLVRQKNGVQVIVDFKTGKSKGYKDDVFNGCTQTMVYAYILEKSLGITVGRGEYHFVKEGKLISCTYTDEMREKVEQLFEDIAESIENGIFDRTKKNEDCRYCDYKDICGRNG